MAVLTRWEHPTYASKEGTSMGVMKPEVEWITEEEAAAHHTKFIKNVFTSVFKLIKNCVSAKDAWVHYLVLLRLGPPMLNS
jgi:hypothetical protein